MGDRQTIYTTTYMTFFAAMFSAMVAISQLHDAFKVDSWGDTPKAVSAGIVTIIAPILFFVWAFQTIASFPNQMDFRRLLWIIVLVAPVYGFQQFWFLIAQFANWNVEIERSCVTMTYQAFWFIVGVVFPSVLVFLQSRHSWPFNSPCC